MQDMGGDLMVTSVHGDGATFIAVIPLPDIAAMREALQRSMVRVSPPRRRERASVLFVDDDNQILRAYSRALGKECNVLLAGDGQEAIDLLSSGSAPDAVVTELALPEADGPTLYRWLCKERPGLAKKTVFVTADSTTVRYESFLRNLDNQVLLKPVNASSLRSAIDSVVNG